MSRTGANAWRRIVQMASVLGPHAHWQTGDAFSASNNQCRSHTRGSSSPHRRRSHMPRMQRSMYDLPPLLPMLGHSGVAEDAAHARAPPERLTLVCAPGGARLPVALDPGAQRMKPGNLPVERHECIRHVGTARVGDSGEESSRPGTWHTQQPDTL